MTALNPSICLVTAYTETLSELAAISTPLMQSYAALHGYTFRVVQRDEEDEGRRKGWIKITPIREALDAGFDFVVWLDIDTIIVRKDIDIRTASVPAADLHMVWHDLDPSRFIDPPHFNAGVMLIRSTDWSREFFKQVWELGPLPHHWHDQATILHLLGYDDCLNLGPQQPGEPNRQHLAPMDTAWNSNVGVDVADDPIVHHYAGVANHVRLGLMKADAATVELRAHGTPEFRRAFSDQLTRWRLDSALL